MSGRSDPGERAGADTNRDHRRPADDTALVKCVGGDAEVVRLELSECIRISEAPALSHRLSELTRGSSSGGADRVELDLSRTRTLDSGALGVFIEFHKDLASSDRTLVLMHPRPEIMSLLKIMKLDTVLNIGGDDQDNAETQTDTNADTTDHRMKDQGPTGDTAGSDD